MSGRSTPGGLILRTSKARAVGVGTGRLGPDAPVVDKVKTPGGIYTRRDIIEAQLRGENVRYGEGTANPRKPE